MRRHTQLIGKVGLLAAAEFKGAFGQYTNEFIDNHRKLAAKM